MKTKDDLKKEYVFRHTKNWDKETTEKYIYNVLEDFSVFYQGYLEGIKSVADKALPILEYTKGKLDSSAGFFQQSVDNLITDLHTHTGG